jgi:hypothetical protein
MSRLHAQETYDNRLALGRDVAKLAIVVMANQTSITASDAAAILPVLRAVKGPDIITEAQAADFNAQLLAALSPSLQDAVAKVRLPEPKPEMRTRVQQFLQRRHPGNPAKFGPPSHAYDRLIEFFVNIAAGT